MSLVERIKSIDWEKYKGTEYYKPNDVAPALIALINLDDEGRNQAVYNQVLFTIGNNHRGTYYFAIQEALGFILIAATIGNSEVSRNCALEMLTDIYCAFGPELTKETFHLYEELQSGVKKEIEGYCSNFQEIATSGSESQRNRALASDLVEFIDDPEC